MTGAYRETWVCGSYCNAQNATAAGSRAWGVLGADGGGGGSVVVECKRRGGVRWAAEASSWLPGGVCYSTTRRNSSRGRGDGLEGTHKGGRRVRGKAEGDGSSWAGRAKGIWGEERG